MNIKELIEVLDELGLEKSRSAFDCVNCGLAANTIQEIRDAMERLYAVYEAANEMLVIWDRDAYDSVDMCAVIDALENALKAIEVAA